MGDEAQPEREKKNPHVGTHHENQQPQAQQKRKRHTLFSTPTMAKKQMGFHSLLHYFT